MTDQVEQLIGRTIDGRYRIEAQIGAGGMGVVYRARQLNVRRDVAIKVLHRERLGDARAVAQFLEEATAVSQLRSPHSVTLLDVGELGEGDAFLVMELVEGRTLRHLLGERELDVEETADIVDAIAQALGEAHARGIVHRDIKPSNVMLARTPGHDAFVKVLDYGLAAPVGDSGQLAGTPAYMAPEVIAEGMCTPASDVYALGVLLFELLTGRPPFTGTSRAILEAQLHDEPPLDDADLPKRLRKLIARCLSKHPQLRPADASAFRKLLLRACGRPQASPRRDDAEGATTSKASETLTTMASLRGESLKEEGDGRRRKIAGALAGLAALALIALAARPRAPEAAGEVAAATAPSAAASVVPPSSASPTPEPSVAATAPRTTGAASAVPAPPAPQARADRLARRAGPPAASATSAPDDYDERLETLLPPPSTSSARSSFDEKVDAILD